MSVVSEIERIKTNITNAYTALEEKGATIPTERNSANLRSVVATIPTGGGSEVTKGFIINEFDSNGYATDVSIVGMTEIPSYYFYVYSSSASHALCKNLINVNLSEGLKKIGISAFQTCTKLALKELPESTTIIGQRSFRGCVAITEMTMKGAITNIDSDAFYGCSNLAKIVIPNITSVPTLGSSVFTNTSIARGTGYVYLPDTLVETAITMTNWSTIASQIKGVSEL